MQIGRINLSLLPVLFVEVGLWFFQLQLRYYIKDAMPLSFDQIAVNPTPVNMRNCQQVLLSMQVKILQKRRLCWKKVGPQIWLCLFIFPPNTLKQLNSLTAIHAPRCLGGLEVTHQTCGVRDTGFDFRQDFLFLPLFAFVLVVLCFFVKNTLFVVKKCNSFCNVNSVSILIWNLWSIIRVSRYGPSIFKNVHTRDHTYATVTLEPVLTRSYYGSEILFKKNS